MFNKMFRNLFSPTPHPSDLSLETIAKAVRAGEAAVVDVREPHEFPSQPKGDYPCRTTSPARPAATSTRSSPA